MQVLAVFPQKEILDTAAFALESQFSAEVHRAYSDKEAIQLFTTLHPKLDAVLIDGAEATITAFVSLVKSLKAETPFVVCLKGQPKDQIKIDGIPILGIADYSRLIEDLKTFFAAVKPKAPTEEKSSEESKYCRIGTNLLIKVSPLDASIFVRLSATHFVKLFQQGDEFNAEDLKRYQQTKKINFMFLLKEDSGKLLKKLNAELENLINSKQVDVRAASELVEESLDTIHELVNSIGITPEVEELVANNVALSMKVMGDFPELKNILQRMHLERDQYIPSHSMMVAHLACAIAVAMDWYSDSTFQKLTCAAFMHDVGIRDHNLCAVKNIQEMEKKFQGKFSTKEVQEYKNHPKRGSALVAKFKEIGAEVDKVILQHHEHPLGTGFPDALNATYITPLAALFIVAHDLVDYAYDHDGKINMEDFIVENETKLQAGNFKKVLKGLLQMT